MRPNFDINLPSIPGKNIKFKIQDIKQTSFGSRRQRFNDNKKDLTKKFIDSFNNFHEAKDLSRLQYQTQASETNSRISLNSASLAEKPKPEYRHILPEDKKHIISLFEKYREYETPLLKQSKFDRGFTFNRADKAKREIQNYQTEEQNNSRKFITDNYYFTSTVIETESEKANQTRGKKHQLKSKRQKPSAVFKSELRQKAWQRDSKTQVPGPGHYHQIEKHESKPKPKKSFVQKDELLVPQNQYKKLKQIITQIVGEQKEHQQDDNRVEQQIKNNRMQYMFIQDDRDRFGQQKYPIATRLNVPGPGTYTIGNTMEEYAKKVALVEEQRKLLKEWFNN